MKSSLLLAITLALMSHTLVLAHHEEGVDVELDANGEVKTPTYKLMYFKTRGRGEVIRTLFAHAGVPFEDVRYDNKGDRAEFYAERDRGTFPFRQVPVLEVDGEIIAQSHAIERFLARRFHLMGNTELEAARIEAICEHIADIFNKHSSIKYDKKIDEAERKSRFVEFFEDFVPPKIQMIEVIAAANKNADDPTLPSWLVGTDVSLADISLHSLLDSYGEKVAETLKSVPTVDAIHKAVAALPNIAEWEETRPPA